MLVALHEILFPPNMPAGMDWAVIGMFTCRFRKGAHPCDPPIVVSRFGDVWRVEDGRHRVMAAMIAGRTHIDAVEAC